MKKYNDNIDKLTPIQFEVTQQNGTERPFTNEYHDEFSEGIYRFCSRRPPLQTLVKWWEWFTALSEMKNRGYYEYFKLFQK